MTVNSFAAPPEDSGWYYCTVTDQNNMKQWINRAQLVKMFANGNGGTTLVFVDGTTANIAETIEAPV